MFEDREGAASAAEEAEFVGERMADAVREEELAGVLEGIGVSAAMRYFILIPTFPIPTFSRDDEGNVRTFATRAEAQAAADEMGVPANVEGRRSGVSS